MKVLVTGATGFIGGNVVRALLDHGYDVRGTSTSIVEKYPGREHLEQIELVRVDVRNPSEVERAMNGCTRIIHTAAVYAYWTPNPSWVYDVNVEGTRNVLEAARKHGVERFVFTSSESTIGIPDGALGTEEYTSEIDHLPGPYKKSKLLAEQLVLQAAAEGLPAVVVNPAMPIGVGDVKPTPSGQVIVDYLRRKMPGYVDTCLNFVDVADVAEGHRAALEKGRVGERYILGNQNMGLREFFGILEAVTGIPAPSIRIPFWAAEAAARVCETVQGRMLSREPRISLVSVQVARKKRFFDCRKAMQELGLPQSPIELACKKAVQWYEDCGYIGRKR